MARIPDIGALRPTPRYGASVARVRNASAVSDAVGGLGEAISGIADKRAEREDRLAYGAARAALLRSDITTRQELENEPDFETWESGYDERMTRARADAAKLIRSSADRSIFESEAELDVARGRAAVSQAVSGRRRDARIATLDEGLTSFLDVSQNAADEPSRAAAREGASELIRGAVERGDISAVDGGNRSRKFVQDDITGHIETMLRDDDLDGAAAFLERNAGQLSPEANISLARRIDEGLDNRLILSRAQEAVHGARPPVGAPSSELAVAGAPGEVADVLTNAGWSDAVVAGFLGNFDVEGGYNGARGDGGAASGIAQWRHERRTNFRQMFGRDPHEATPAEQAKFVIWEMQNPEKAGMSAAQRDAILNASGPEEAAALIDRHYERSSGEHRGRRQEAARGFYGGAAQGPMKHDLNDVYASIDARAEAEGWSPEETESVKAQASRIVERDERLLSRQFEDAADEAARVIASLPDGLTNIAQIPRNIRERMDPTDVAKLEQDIREKREAKAEKELEAAQQRRSVELEFMRRFEPARFKRLNPLQEARNLSPADYAKFMMDHLEANEREAFDPTGIRGGISEEINFQERRGGNKLKDDEKVRLYDFMEAQLNIINSKKGRIERADYTDAYRTAMRNAVSGGREIDTPTYEVLSEVPEDVEADIVRNWQGRVPPTKGQIIAAWMRLQSER